MSALGWGIMATGGIAEAFAADLRLDGRRLAAVGSRTAAKAEQFAKRHGAERAHGSYESLVSDPAVDIVYVATPHTHHLEGALAAIAAGKSVLVEKPLTVNAAEARALAAAAAAAGVSAMEAMWTRFLPHMVRLRQMIAEGELGELRGLTVDHTQKLPDDPHHRINDLALGGGALLDLGVYPIAFAQDIFGPPASVRVKSASFGPTGVDKAVTGEFTYASGATALWVTASDSAGPNVAAVLGSKAQAHLDGVWYTPTELQLAATDGAVLEVFDGRTPGRGMQFQARELERLVERGLPTSEIMPLADSIQTLAIMDQIRAEIGVRYAADGPVGRDPR
ncbi:MAG: Gfo/Idh/MocA family oxidoreductase [Bifidobacteriaceae bacterium]|jgi:predicted dehydrogenase|nr:Gfo/Idh/MocA family oxidoreductase [Bifidobacteriaceae bacterium]